MDGQKIRLSHKGVEAQLVGTAAVAVGLCVSFGLFFTLSGVKPATRLVLAIICWGSTAILWGSYALLLQKKWKTDSYVLMPDTLVITRGGFTGTRQEFYRYDSILSVNIRQSNYGRRHNYGTVTIVIPKLEHPLNIPYVADPENQVLAIKEAVARTQAGSGTQSLIH